MTSDEAAQRLAEARARLWRTLSGRSVPINQQQNAAPDINEPYHVMAAQIKLNEAEQAKLNQFKREMVSTLSQGKKNGGFDDGTRVVEYPAAELQKQNAARSELRQRLAGQTRRMIQNQSCPRDNGSTGIKNAAEDSAGTITPSGTPFSGGWEITGRGGRITLASIAADEQDAAGEGDSSPATTSDQQRDHNVRRHMGARYTPIPTKDETESAILKTMRR